MATNILSMNRGDSFELRIKINFEPHSHLPYQLKEGDALYFGLMDPNQSFENALIKKKIIPDEEIVYKHGTAIIRLDPEDTIDLIPGKYYYQIKLKRVRYDEDGEEHTFVDTVIDKTKFVIYP